MRWGPQLEIVPFLKSQNKNNKNSMASKFKLSTIISYFFLWTAEHDVLKVHKIKRNTEVVVLSPILSLKAEQQRKVINLFLLFSPSSPPIFSYSIPYMCDAKATILVTKKLLFTLSM